MKNKSNIITEAQFRKILSESVRRILNEDVESSGMKAAINFLIRQGQSKERAQKIFNSLRTDIPSIRLPLYTNTNGREKGTYKFAIGIERMYLNGELSDGQAIMKLNKTLKLLANGHADEYDANLNNMSAQELNRRFETAAASELQNDVDDVNSEEYTPNSYTVVRIPDFETSKQYGDYTSWCVTHQADMYDSYTGNGAGLFYFFLKDGFKKIKPVRGEGCPLDEYGLSMIAVSVNMDGSLNTVTCRWNHDNGGNDNIMDAKQVSRAVGMNVYNVCKPYTREELHAKGVVLFDEVQDLLDNGTPPEEIFNDVYPFREGIAIIELNNKWNYINTEGKLLSNQWFDCAGHFNEGFARVSLNNKWNFINTEGKLLTNQWFNWANGFDEGFARVKLNGKFNYINTEGKLLSNQWFNGVGDFHEGFAYVELNDECNYINTEGKILISQWFDHAGHFNEGFASVSLNNKWNFINTEGKFLSNQWFDGVVFFKEGFANVELNDKWNYINTEGKLLSNQWFDCACHFNRGFANVALNNKWNYINTDGKLLSNQWFNDVGNFHEGFAYVKLNGKFNFINTEGNILSNQWFKDIVSGFKNGIAKIWDDGEIKCINTKGEIIDNNINETKTTKYMKQKKTITESQLRKMISKSLKTILESKEDDKRYNDELNYYTKQNFDYLDKEYVKGGKYLKDQRKDLRAAAENNPELKKQINKAKRNGDYDYLASEYTGNYDFDTHTPDYDTNYGKSVKKIETDAMWNAKKNADFIHVPKETPYEDMSKWDKDDVFYTNDYYNDSDSKFTFDNNEVGYHPALNDEYWDGHESKKTKKKTITESQLRKIVVEAINEINGWKLEEEDITPVNTENDGRFRFLIKLWWGSGYIMDCYSAYAQHEEEALYYVVAWIEQNHPEYLKTVDNNAQEFLQELAQENNLEDVYEAEELPEFTEKYMYVDATMEGAQQPHYIYSENLQVTKYPQGVNENKKNMKTKKTITESQLRKMVVECISKTLKEGTSDTTYQDAWFEIQEMLGAEEMNTALYKYLSADQIQDFVDYTDRCYELHLFDGEYDGQ